MHSNARAHHRKIELKRFSWRRAFSETHSNPGGGKGRWLSQRYVYKSMAAREASGVLGDPGLRPFLAHRDATRASSPFFLPSYFPSSTSLRPLPLSPVQSMIVHSPLLPKHFPFLCEAIHRVIRIPALVREFLHWHSDGTWIKSLFSIATNWQDHTAHKYPGLQFNPPTPGMFWFYS